MQKIITKGNSAVVINNQDGHIWACLYVNARDGIANASITPSRWSGKTMKGAEKWAARQLASPKAMTPRDTAIEAFYADSHPLLDKYKEFNGIDADNGYGVDLAELIAFAELLETLGRLPQ